MIQATANWNGPALVMAKQREDSPPITSSLTTCQIGALAGTAGSRSVFATLIVVRYRPRGGALINWLFVRRDVERIFRYREQRLKDLLGGERK